MKETISSDGDQQLVMVRVIFNSPKSWDTIARRYIELVPLDLHSGNPPSHLKQILTNVSKFVESGRRRTKPSVIPTLAPTLW
jgi:hypothetical protein